MSTKVCTKCREEKPFSDFYKHKGGKFDLRAQCIPCRNSVAVQWEKKNPEAAKSRRSKAEKSESTQEYRRGYRKLNRAYFRAKCAEYNASKKCATPTWLTVEQRRQIEEVYLHAKDCTLVSGEQYDVDHIVPLQGKGVCGLHVPWNLQVLPSDINRSKSNKYEADR